MLFVCGDLASIVVARVKYALRTMMISRAMGRMTTVPTWEENVAHCVCSLLSLPPSEHRHVVRPSVRPIDIGSLKNGSGTEGRSCAFCGRERESAT